MRVYDPNFGSDDSSTKYPSYVGHILRLHYGYDFYVSPPYQAGSYQIQLRVNFLNETSVYVTCP